MKLIIDIPDYNLDEVQNGSIACGVILKAIKNGTVLPKGHGDLIDRQAIIDNGIEKGFCDWYDEIKYAPSVIEADKENGND